MTPTPKTPGLTARPDARTLNALSPQERLAVIRQASGRRQLQLLLDADDAAALMPQLASQDLYLLVREVGVVDVADVLALASPAQWTVLMDLDIWQEDEIDPTKALVWLQLLLDTGPENLCATVEAMETELVTALFSRYLWVTRGPEAYDSDDVDNARRVEALYDVEFFDSDEDSEPAKIVGQVLAVLMKEAPQLYVWLLESLRAETPLTLQEEAYQFHRGRLEDLGFADPVTARQVFAYCDPHGFVVPADPRPALSLTGEEVAPGVLAAPAAAQPLLEEVLSQAAGEDTAWELALLLNRVIAADQIDAGDRSQVEGALELVWSLLNLGLDHLSEGHVERALEIFPRVYLQELFRIGHSLTLELQDWAGKLQAAPMAARLDPPFRRCLDGLLLPRPQLWRGLDQPPREGYRPFVSRQDLRSATWWLEAIAGQEHLFAGALPFGPDVFDNTDLAGCQPATAADLTLARLFLTALANKLFDGDFLPQPLPQERLPELQALIQVDGQLDPQLRDGTIAWLEELVPDSGRFGGYCLDLWQEGLCRLDPAALDPRYIGGLIVRQEPT